MNGDKFTWSAEDLLPLGDGEMLATEAEVGIPRPPWPKNSYDLTGLSRLADWVQERLPDAFAVWQRRVESQVTHRLRRAERDALKRGFLATGTPQRWREVAALVRAGGNSRRFVHTIATLIELGGFSPRAHVGDHRSVKTVRDRNLVRMILSLDYPGRPPQSINLMATTVTAILLNPATGIPDRDLRRDQTIYVRKAMKKHSDGEDTLELFCWQALEDEPED